MPLSNQELQQRLAQQQWTAHNIRLTPEVTTMPGRPDFMETDMRLHSILRVLRLAYSSLSALRLADLGCLEGGFGLAMAQRGMNVIGIEARQSNFDKAMLIKEHFELPNLEFRRDDVKNFARENYGVFDIVLALGILYHLDQPIEWIRQVAGATKAVLIVDSHYAPADNAAMSQLDPRISQLSSLQKMEDGGISYEGRWFSDCSRDMDREAQPWSSYSNNESFWLTKDSLLTVLRRAGFDLVAEQYDPWGDRYNFHATNYVRGMFLAIKTSALVR